MTINVIAIQPLVALIAGILILVIPRLLNIIIALYLIIIGLLGLGILGGLFVLITVVVFTKPNPFGATFTNTTRATIAWAYWYSSLGVT